MNDEPRPSKGISAWLIVLLVGGALIVCAVPGLVICGGIGMYWMAEAKPMPEHMDDDTIKSSPPQSPKTAAEKQPAKQPSEKPPGKSKEPQR